jgi:heterotetrameric sarcosine oxidase gamma subunit
MSANPADAQLSSSVIERSLASCIEVVLSGARSATLQSPWNAMPGAVQRFTARAAALNFAPARWLLIDAGAEVIADAVANGAMVIDVDGKWRCFEVRGAHAAAVLSAAVNPAVILAGRACAAVHVLDCPAVIARCANDTDFEVYVSASYATSLRAGLERALQRNART